MKKEEILDIIVEKLEDVLTECDVIDISVTKNMKNNGVCYIGISIKLADTNIVPCIYIDSYLPKPDKWGCYDDSLFDLDYITGCVKNDLMNAIEDANLIDTSELFQEAMTDNIIMALVNYEQNAERLIDCPYILYQDLAITYRQLVKCNGMNGSVLINNCMAERWGKSAEDLFSYALNNTMKKFPPVIEKLDDVIKKLMGQTFNTCEEIPPSPFYIVTNIKGMLGATSIIYDGLLDEVRDMLGENFYILPSSVNEVLIIPESYDMDSDSLCSMVKDVNDSIVDETEILSYSVYFYDGNFKNISTNIA